MCGSCISNHTILEAFSDDELKAEDKAAKASALCLGPPGLDPFDLSCHQNQQTCSADEGTNNKSIIVTNSEEGKYLALDLGDRI